MATLHIDDDNPVLFHLQTVVCEELLEENEILTAAATFKSNLYLGTSLGNVLHYYRFDDSPVYILVSRIPASSSQKPVVKIAVLELVERAIVLCGSVALTYALPELSPCKLGKLKDVRHVEVLCYMKGIANGPNASQMALVVGYNKVRIIQVARDLIKLAKDINYTDALKGSSCAATSGSAYSNLVVVANKSNYDLIDLKETRMISLFQYKTTDDPEILPHCAPYVPESGREEYLLTIHADSSTSIAMCVNSDGDVTRGTLSWENLGYPHSIAASWPYVFAVMEDSQLVVSSLQTIEHKARAKHEGLRLIQQRHPVQGKDEITSDLLTVVDKSGSLRTEVSAESTVIALRANELLLIHEASGLSVLVGQLQKLMSEPKFEPQHEDWFSLSKCFEKEIKSTTGVQRSLLIHILCYIHILRGASTEALNCLLDIENDKLIVHPRVGVYLLTGASGDDVRTFEILKTFVVNERFEKDSHMLRDYLMRVHKYYMGCDYTKMDEQTRSDVSYVREELYTSVLSGSKEITHFAKNQDREGWKEFKEANDSILDQLRNGKSDWARVEVLRSLAMNEQAMNKKQIYAVEICATATSLIKRQTSDDELGDDLTTLSDAILEALRDSFVDEKLYAKNLLSFLDIDTARGVDFIRRQKGGTFKATHKYILDEISEKYGDKNDEVRQLKAEFAEASLKDDIADASTLEDITTISEALLEIGIMLAASPEADLLNFEVLQQTFQIENSLDNLDWPKLCWAEYLSVNKRRSECPAFIDLYLKTMELIVVQFQWLESTELASKVSLILEARQFEYLRWIIEGEDIIKRLLGYCDFTSAEHMAVYGKLPLQSTCYFFEDFKGFATKTTNDPKAVSSALSTILDCYLEFVLGNKRGYLIIQRFLKRYGNHFALPDMLKKIPELFPISYLQEYIQQGLLRKLVVARHMMATKALARYEAKSTSALNKGLEEGI